MRTNIDSGRKEKEEKREIIKKLLVIGVFRSRFLIVEDKSIRPNLFDSKNFSCINDFNK